jgi:tetratricopeptide (TPR) repeat protein
VTEDARERSLRLLHAGNLAEAVPLLQGLLRLDPKDEEALYNLGMALSDLGCLDEAKRHLLRLIDLDPENSNALVALGVACQRSGDPEAARDYLDRAISLDPSNPYAHKNLAAVLGNLGRHEAAVEHLRAADQLVPGDQATIYGLALGLSHLGGEDQLREADALYKRVIDLNPESDIAERAKQALSKIAHTTFRERGGQGEQFDAVMYCLSALERFAQMSPDQVRQVALEIAMLGRTGIDINNPEHRYQLRSLPGDFSGLQLTSYMYVAFKQIAPEYDIGFDLSGEYEAATKLHARQNDEDAPLSPPSSR